MVRYPLTYMRKTANLPYYTNETINEIENVVEQNTISEEKNEKVQNNKEITVIEYYSDKISKEVSEGTNTYAEIQIIEKYGAEDERVYINMEFLGLDLSKIPSKDFSDWKTYIIPILYVITTFISMKITTTMQKKNVKEKRAVSADGESKEEETDVMAQTNRNMTYMMPIIAVSISLIAPLGLALYWLTNNILMIVERLILNKIIDDKEEEANA